MQTRTPVLYFEQMILRVKTVVALDIGIVDGKNQFPFSLIQQEFSAVSAKK